jgi:4-diphosphocytidyl-2-C-methyl-D-erythritol kinase
VQLRETAPAKINWILKVFERRPDGFHRIETVMIKTGLADDLEISVSDGDGIDVTVEDDPSLSSPENLGWKAAEAYLREAGVRKAVSIWMRKRIFVAAGLGGGSSDAAAVLRGLERNMGCLGPSKLRDLGAKLGSDVPFFLHDCQVGIGMGRGEEIVSWPSLPSRPLLLVNPGFPVSTKTAYEKLGRGLTWEGPGDTPLALARRPEKWSDLTGLLRARNDLQEVVERLHPEIAGIRHRLREAGAEISQMSGSGGTVFGLFGNREIARGAEREMGKRWSTVLTETGV